MSKKRILCFGDSNTWGYNPQTSERFEADVRWTGVLQSLLGTDYVVIEEGLNGRTTVWDDPIEGDKNGLKHLGPCLESQKPLDLVILMLGTNDLKNRFSVSAEDIAESQKPLINTINTSSAGATRSQCRILLLAPPSAVKLTNFSEQFIGAEEKSEHFGVKYAKVAKEMNCAFLDMGAHIISSSIDGIHLEADQHAIMAKVLANKIKEIV